MTTNEILKPKGMKVTYVSEDQFLIKIEYTGEDIRSGEYVGTKSDDEYFLFVKDTNVSGVYYFGCEQLKDDYMHKAGYIWSSRAGVINDAFDMALKEVCINNNACYSMDVYYLKPLLEEYFGKKITVREFVKHNSDGSKETTFKFEEVE
jgi:hypothetical protein